MMEQKSLKVMCARTILTALKVVIPVSKIGKKGLKSSRHALSVGYESLIFQRILKHAMMEQKSLKVMCAMTLLTALVKRMKVTTVLMKVTVVPQEMVIDIRGSFKNANENLCLKTREKAFFKKLPLICY